MSEKKVTLNTPLKVSTSKNKSGAVEYSADASIYNSLELDVSRGSDLASEFDRLRKDALDSEKEDMLRYKKIAQNNILKEYKKKFSKRKKNDRYRLKANNEVRKAFSNMEKATRTYQIRDIEKVCIKELTVLSDMII